MHQLDSLLRVSDWLPDFHGPRSCETFLPNFHLTDTEFAWCLFDRIIDHVEVTGAGKSFYLDLPIDMLEHSVQPGLMSKLYPPEDPIRVDWFYRGHQIRGMTECLWDQEG